MKKLAKTLNLKVTAGFCQEIYTACGGYLWLLREAFRYARDNQTLSVAEIMSKSRINERVEYIFNLLDQDSRDGLNEILQSHSIKKVPPETGRFLTDTGLVSQLNGKYDLSLQLLKPLLDNRKAIVKLNLSPTQSFTWNDSVIDAHFSPVERNQSTIASCPSSGC